MGRTNKKQEITMETIVQRDPDQEFSKIDDEVVMLSMKNGEYYALNSVASRIWEIIEEQKKLSEVVEILMDEFEVDRETCLEETKECLHDLSEKKLLKEE